MSRRLMLRNESGGANYANFVPGSYAGGKNGTCINTVDSNGVITCNSGDILYLVTIPISAPIYYRAGDVIMFEQDVNYTSLAGTRNLTLRGSRDVGLIGSHDTLSGYASKQITVVEDGYFDKNYWGIFTGYQAGARIHYRILINGVVVLE